jgi:Skp family chaperone for outer membrane proteins
VKRTVGIVAGVVALCMVGYIGSRLAAEPPKAPAAGTPAAPQPQTKVAVLNLSYVIKNYKKWEAFQADYKKKLEGFDAQLKPMKDDYEKYEKEIKKPEVSAATKEDYGKKMREIQRVMQDKAEDYKKVLAEFEANSFTTIYNDVKYWTERYARAKGIELVMHYNDGTTEAEVNAATNIGRKMGQGACFPLYVAEGMDISKQVVAYLNQAVTSAPTNYTKPAGSGN